MRARPLFLAAPLSCLRAAAGLAAFLALAALWQVRPRRGRLTRLAMRLLLAGFRQRVRVIGTPLPAPALFVANHVSWTDIVALATVLDAGFVAKSEVAGWPLIGRLATQYRCHFLDRASRGDTHRRVAAIRAEPPQSLVLFPEGTTGAGPGTLPFRSSLFAASTGEAALPVQPVTILHRRADGTPAQALHAWVGDDTLLAHAGRLVRGPGTIIEIRFEAPLPPADRKTLARASEAAVNARLAEVEEG